MNCAGVHRWVDRLPRPVFTFLLLEAAIGVSAFLGLFLFAEIPYLFVVLYRWFSGSLNLLFFSKFLLAGAVMFLPTLFIGALFPLVAKLYTTNLERVGFSIGKVYSLNTLGSIAGSFCAGFTFVPFLGIQQSILLAIGVNIFLAFVLLLAVRAWPLLPRISAALALIVVGQFILGLSNVLFGLPLAVADAHNAGAALLIAALVVINFFAFRGLRPSW
jgi:heme A synthase